MNRRQYLGLVGSGAIAAIAGCSGTTAEERRSPTKQKQHLLKYNVKTHQSLYVGESLGARFGDEMWRVTITDKKDNGAITLKVEKTVLDEVGANKESVDASFMFTRKRVQPNDIERIEDDFRVWYATNDGKRSRLAISQTIDQDQVSKLNGSRVVI